VQDFGQNILDTDGLEDSHAPSDVGPPRLREPTADDADEYFAELPTWQLILEVRRLMAAECRAERLVCRYLADLADRVRQRSDATLMAYSDEFDALRGCFGLGLREARERLRVGRALRQLPRLERAFVAGELAYSRIREVTRVATPQTEHEWLERARHLNMRQLERRVAQPAEPLRGAPPRRDSTRPPPDERRTPPLQRITFELSADAWTLVQRALQQVRTITGSDLSDGDALEILARGALARAADLEEDLTSAADRSENTSPPWAAGGHPPADPSDAEAPQSSTGPAGDSTGAFREPETTQGGSPTAGIPYPTSETVVSPRERQLVAIGALPDDPAARALLGLMDDRHGWTTEELMEVSGWSYNEVCCAVVLLEIGHWVQRDFFSWLIVKTQRSRPAR
jgi:hypothetical protein